MAVIANKATVIFLVDTSGSMFGQKIEAVNAAIAECLEVIRNHNNDNSIQMGYATFDEKWEDFVVKDDIGAVSFKVRSNSDGFYSLTSFRCLYEGMERCLEVFGNEKNNGKSRLCLFLITDGKPADSGEYTEVLERVKSMNVFRNAERYVALVGSDANGMGNDILEFVGYKADKIVKLNDAASALLKVSFLSELNNNDNSADTARYNKIFGD